MELQEEPTDGLVNGSVTVSNELSLMDRPHQTRQFSPVCPRALYWVHLCSFCMSMPLEAKVLPQTTIKVFADDCLLYRTIDSVADQLQQDLDSMVDWSNTWLMRFNNLILAIIKM